MCLSFLFAGAAAAAQTQYAYITNANDNTVSVIDTSVDGVITTIPVGGFSNLGRS